MADPEEVIVVGAGVIGLSAALCLRERGYGVRVLDREGVGAGASAGNAGAFAFADIIPLATPGIMRRVPRWFFDPTGPLSIPPRHALHVLPWLLRFWRASQPDRHAESLAAQAALMAQSAAALGRRLQASGMGGLIRDDGQLQLYDGQRSFRSSLPHWAEREARGIPFRHLHSASEIAACQPGIAGRFGYATFTPEWRSVTDPALWTRRLAETFEALGGRIEIREVTALEAAGERPVVTADGRNLAADHVVVAAGAFSQRLLAPTGIRIPLETERGYNTTLPEGAFDLRTDLTFGDHGFVVTRAGGGVRVGGAIELGGLDAPPNHARSKALLRRAKRFLPELETGGGTEWMGFRPSLPDSLPVIGSHPALPGVTLAFGHGHLGLTQSAGTGELVADLVVGATPEIDLRPFRPTRFRELP